MDHGQNANTRTFCHQEAALFEASHTSRFGTCSFRKQDHGCSSSQIIIRHSHHMTSTATRSPLDRDISMHTQYPSENRELHHLPFRNPFEIERQHIHQRHIEHRLMVGHNHIRFTAVNFFTSVHLDFPKRAKTVYPQRPESRCTVKHHPLPIESHRQQEKQGKRNKTDDRKQQKKEIIEH